MGSSRSYSVNSWTEKEINVLVQAWSEVEEKYPLLRCERGTGSLHAKMYALFSQRSTFPRSSLAVDHAKNYIRGFVLFVVKYDKERLKDGGRLWFDLSLKERNQRRNLVPRRSRSMATALSKDAFAKLLKMERAQRWLEGDAVAGDKQQEEAQPDQPEPNTKLSMKRKADSVARIRDFSPPIFPNKKRFAEELEEKTHVSVQERSDTSTCSLYSDKDEDSAFSTPEREEKPPTVRQELQSSVKHRDCFLLLEKMMKLQVTKMHRAVTKLRSNVEMEIQRSSEMLHSIISNQFDDPASSSDVAFVKKVLNMQQQQVRDRFDQFEDKRIREEADNRAILDQRFR